MNIIPFFLIGKEIPLFVFVGVFVRYFAPSIESIHSLFLPSSLDPLSAAFNPIQKEQQALFLPFFHRFLYIKLKMKDERPNS